MGSKKQTTMAKLNRETKLRDKRAQKQARKAARKLTAGSEAAEASTPRDEPGPAAAVSDVTGGV